MAGVISRNLSMADAPLYWPSPVLILQLLVLDGEGDEDNSENVSKEKLEFYFGNIGPV